jgi:hypothetical protein
MTTQNINEQNMGRASTAKVRPGTGGREAAMASKARNDERRENILNRSTGSTAETAIMPETSNKYGPVNNSLLSSFQQIVGDSNTSSLNRLQGMQSNMADKEAQRKSDMADKEAKRNREQQAFMSGYSSPAQMAQRLQIETQRQNQARDRQYAQSRSMGF